MVTKKKVLVTGANGFIALHCISKLLDNGFNVKGSLKDLKKESLVRESLGSKLNRGNFEICKLNLLEDHGWEEATSNCDYLLHIASPCVIKEPKNENEIIYPAVNGTLRAIKAAHKANIKKIVITSSVGSIVYGHNKNICDSNDWTDVSFSVGAYIKSKTLAEKAAWDYFDKLRRPKFSMTSINPGMVFGPLLSNQVNSTSADLILKMINGSFPALPNIYFSVVDVRDIAKLHIDSLTNTNSDHKRIIAASSKAIPFIEISRKLRKLGYDKSTLKLVPDQLIKILSIFNKDMKTSVSMIKRGSYSLDISETTLIYDWNPIPFDRTINDMCLSLENFVR